MRAHVRTAVRRTLASESTTSGASAAMTGRAAGPKWPRAWAACARTAAEASFNWASAPKDFGRGLAVFSQKVDRPQTDRLVAGAQIL